MFRSIALWFDPYVDLLTHVIHSQSALAPLFLLFVEEAGVPLFIPGDVALAYTGYQLSVTGSTPLWLAFCVALTAVLAGSSVLFYVSRRWGNKVIQKIGKFIFLKESDIIRAERLFKRYGVWTIIIGRHIPGMRIPITVFAGASGMRYRSFIISTLVSTILWVILALHIGRRYGASIAHLIHKNIGIGLTLAALAIIVAVALHIVGSREHRNKTNN